MIERTSTGFDDVTRVVLEGLERRLPGATVVLSHHDRVRMESTVVDTAGPTDMGVTPGDVMPLESTFCAFMARGDGPGLCPDVASEPVYRDLAACAALDIGSYVGAPVKLADGTCVGAICAIDVEPGRFGREDHVLMSAMADMLSRELDAEPGEDPPIERAAARLRDRAAARRGTRTPGLVGLRGLAPFLGAAVLALLTIPLPTATEPGVVGLVEATVLLLVLVVAGTLMPWHLYPRVVRMAPALAYFVVVALLREAEGGGTSGFAVLVLLPVLFVALHGDRLELVVAVAGAGLTLVLPILLLGAPNYPVTEWRRAILVTAVAAVLGKAVQELVAATRRRALQAGERADRNAEQTEELAELNANLEVVLRVARELSADGDMPATICTAAVEIAAADFAVLLEAESDDLVLSGQSGSELPATRIAMDGEPAGSTIAFSTQTPYFAGEALGDPGVNTRLREATGARSVLFEPVVARGESVGVLVVGWRRPSRGVTDRARPALGLLAAEAAVAMQRAELLGRLEQAARTDPLTGLPNRRVWDEDLPRELARARRGGTVVTIAVLDLDHFKRYNDEHGHPAGDRLLVAAAAAWRAELRETDLLVRLGGEEFGVALPGPDADDHAAVLERLRAATPGDQTCSAGLATSDGFEDAAMLFARADAALYGAKRGGRDRVALAAPPVAALTAGL